MNAERKKHEADLKARERQAEKRFADLNGLPVRIHPWRIDWDSPAYIAWLNQKQRGHGDDSAQ